MHLENSLEDMNVIGNALATVTSNASRFSNAKVVSSSEHVQEQRPGSRYRSLIKRAARHTGFTGKKYVKTACLPVQENDAAAQLAEIEVKLAELTAKHVRLAHAISDYTAEKIRSSFGESRYEDLKNVDLTIRGLEGFVNKLIRDSAQPHPHMLRLIDSVTEYRLAVSGLLMILDQCFNKVEVVEPKTGFIDEGLFTDFSFH